jgi:hypothetical protein
LIYLKTKTEGLPSVFTYDFFINSVPSELTWTFSFCSSFLWLTEPL